MPPMAQGSTAETLRSLPQAALAGLACEVAANGDVDGARALVRAGASMDSCTSHDRRTPLHLAAATGNLRMVQFLVEECKVTMRRDRFGMLPINDAVQCDHSEVRRYLQDLKLKTEFSMAPSTPGVEPGSPMSPRIAMSVRSGGSPLAHEPREQLVGTVFELVVKQGVFSYNMVHAEVSHYFGKLGLPESYFESFTPLQIANHVHCLMAAKHVAQATNDPAGLHFDLTTERSGVFLTSVCDTGTGLGGDAQARTEAIVAPHLEKMVSKENGMMSLTFVSSEGSLYKRAAGEKLGIYTTEFASNEVQAGTRGEEESSLDIVGSPAFLKGISSAMKEQYQIVMEDVVSTKCPAIRIVPPNMFDGTCGSLMLFASPEIKGRIYFTEVCQALRFTGITPRRMYMETFANGIVIFSLFLGSASNEAADRLTRAIMSATQLKVGTGISAMIYDSAMSSKIPFDVALYLTAVAKFVYAFFPRELYASDYLDVHKVLQHDAGSQRKLENLYKFCMKDLLSTERILEVFQKHLILAPDFFEDFKRIATGTAKPAYSEEIARKIDQRCTETQDRQILKMVLTFNASLLLTNFFKPNNTGAFAFRLNPAITLKDRPKSLYPEIPYGIYFITGRNFQGFHCRFRDVARGGIRTVLSRDPAAYERNVATLFDECYNLAFTQQLKNKDIPEGGSKGVILPEELCPSFSAQKAIFTKYFGALLDCMMPEKCSMYTGHLNGNKEILYFGPDENTAGLMDHGALLGKSRGYPYWKALTTGKSVMYGGVPHDVYGMTTASVHKYVTELLDRLGLDETKITKFQTGGPDGDLGSNEILMSKDRTVGLADGSGVVYDPAGLNRPELERLARARLTCKEFARNKLGPQGFLVTCEQKDVVLPDGSKWATGTALRDVFHLTPYATADLFVPCGGRPNAVHSDNVCKMFSEGKPKFKYIAEGANLFISDAARSVLETAGVHLFKDASTNKGGVCSSSLEVQVALALPDDQHTAMMTYDPKVARAPAFYTGYAEQILGIVRENARLEFGAVWDHNQKHGVPKVQCTKMLSQKINKMSDCLQEHLKNGMSAAERNQLLRCVLKRAVPPLLLEKIGIEGVIARVPPNYVGAMVGAWVASRFVYKNGIEASEVTFFFFLRDLLGSQGCASDDCGAPSNVSTATPEDIPDEKQLGENTSHPNDVALVMQQANCSCVQAMRALKMKGNDVVDAIVYAGSTR